MAIKNKAVREKKAAAYKKYLEDVASRSKMSKKKRDALKSDRRIALEKKNKEKKIALQKRNKELSKESIARAAAKKSGTGPSNITKLQWLNTGGVV